MNDTLRAALQCSDSHVPTFPTNGKLPLTAHGFHDATCDQTQLRNWWAIYPTANLGMPTGKASGLVVLDVDPRHGGNESLAALEKKYGALPDTMESRTGGGGRHIFFSLVEGQLIKNTTAVLGPGLDTRGEGGYVVLPPSKHPETGQPYAWSRPVDPVPMPQWLVELLIRKPPPPPAADPEQPVTQGLRHGFLVSLAGAMQHRGCSLEVITAALLDTNNKRCSPPISEAKVRKIADDIFARYAPAPIPPGEPEIEIPERPARVPNVTAEEVKKQAEKPKEEPVVLAKETKVEDMPETVLDGRLGEIYQRRMSDFPRAFAWPALLTCAGALFRSQTGPLRANLYTALIGKWHVGKTKCIEYAQFLLEVIPPVVEEGDFKPGSAEGLLTHVGDKHGEGFLYAPDELSHLFEKAQIKNASFNSILCSVFDKNRQTLTVEKQKKVSFNCRLSILGGLVEDKFEEAFGAATAGGLWDRFLFGLCPTGYKWSYHPIEGEREISQTYFDEVPVDREIWQFIKALPDEEKEKLGRAIEISLRVAHICAGVDGRDRLRLKDLGPAWELARYIAQTKARLQLNPGLTYGGIVSIKVLNYLKQHAPNGQWVSRRNILHETHAYRYGYSVFAQAIQAMLNEGELEQKLNKPAVGRPSQLLRLPPEEK